MGGEVGISASKLSCGVRNSSTDYTIPHSHLTLGWSIGEVGRRARVVDVDGPTLAVNIITISYVMFISTEACSVDMDSSSTIISINCSATVTAICS